MPVTRSRRPRGQVATDLTISEIENRCEELRRDLEFYKLKRPGTKGIDRQIVDQEIITLQHEYGSLRDAAKDRQASSRAVATDEATLTKPDGQVDEKAKEEGCSGVSGNGTGVTGPVPPNPTTATMESYAGSESGLVALYRRLQGVARPQAINVPRTLPREERDRRRRWAAAVRNFNKQRAETQDRQS